MTGLSIAGNTGISRAQWRCLWRDGTTEIDVGFGFGAARTAKGENWRRGWESNRVRPLKRRKSFILRNARNAKNAQFAELGYAAGTRDP